LRNWRASDAVRDRIIITLFAGAMMVVAAVLAVTWTPWAGVVTFAAVAIVLLTALHVPYTRELPPIREPAPAEAANAFVDPETGLGNQAFLDVLWSKEVSRFGRAGVPFSLAVIDVRTAADPRAPLPPGVMAAVAERVHESVRGHDTLVRLSPWKLAVLLPQANVDGARSFFARVRDGVQGRPIVTGGGHQLRVAGGSASWSLRMGSLADLARAADTDLHRYAASLLYQSKEWEGSQDAGRSAGQSSEGV
jgi:GGDEF domain-containing protein